MSCSVSHIAKVGGVNRNAAWCSFVPVHNVADCVRDNQNYARDNQDYIKLCFLYRPVNVFVLP